MRRATAWRNVTPMAGSILLHLTILAVLHPATPPQEERFPRQAIEVTLERALAPPAAPAPPVTALAPGPASSTLPLQRPLSNSAAALFLATAWRPAEAPPATTPSELAAGLSSASVHARDVQDRVHTPPAWQPRQQAAPRARQQAPVGVDMASHASQRDAEQDYVLLVVRKLSQVRFSTDADPRRGARGVVVARLTVDRDGRLADLSLAKASGSAAVDSGILENVRKAAPFAPLPKHLAGGPFSFIVPIKYAPEP